MRYLLLAVVLFVTGFGLAAIVGMYEAALPSAASTTCPCCACTACPCDCGECDCNVCAPQLCRDAA